MLKITTEFNSSAPVTSVRLGGTQRGGIRQNSISSLGVAARRQRAGNRTLGTPSFLTHSSPISNSNNSARSQHSDDTSDGYRTPTPTVTSESDGNFLDAAFLGGLPASRPRVRRISYQSSPECTPEPPSDRDENRNDHTSDADDNNNDSPLISSQRHRRILSGSATANQHNASLRGGGITAMRVRSATLGEDHDDVNDDDETENLSVIGGRQRRRKRVVSLQSTPDASPTRTNAIANQGQVSGASRSSSVEILNVDNTVVLPDTPPSSRNERRRTTRRNGNRRRRGAGAGGDALLDGGNSTILVQSDEEEGRDGSSSDEHFPETPPLPRLRTGRYNRQGGALLSHSPDFGEWQSNMGYGLTGITSWHESASSNRTLNRSPLRSRILPGSRNVSTTNRSNTTNSSTNQDASRRRANVVSSRNTNSSSTNGTSDGIHRISQTGLVALGHNYRTYRNHAPILLSDSTDEEDHAANQARRDSIELPVDVGGVANANGRRARTQRSNTLLNNDGLFGDQQQNTGAVGRSSGTALDSDVGILSTHANATAAVASNPTRNLNFNSSHYIRNQVLNEVSPRTRHTIEELLADDEEPESGADRVDQRGVDRHPTSTDLPTGRLRAERAIPRTYGMFNLARPQRAVAIRAAELARRNRNLGTSLLGSFIPSSELTNNYRRLAPMMRNVELASSSSDSDSSADSNHNAVLLDGDIQIFGDEHPTESGAAAARRRQEMDDYLLALRIAAEIDDDIPSSSSQAADRHNSTTSRTRNSRRASNAGGTPRRSGEQFRNQRPLAPGEHCVICYEEAPDEPVGCLRCRQLIGCRRCILKWRRTNNISELNRRSPLSMGCSSVNHRKCPLCRAEWYVEPEIAPWDELRTD
ncbi:unnamed protein product [Anisakis simplex]|uniref:RING-type domain-containing protein n=1 Tax=Anisakis simplex TaxID=6269 RepID=A0A3P6RJF5_ANISI|nr:unnamed protein product [Anisakis simplex]